MGNFVLIRTVYLKPDHCGDDGRNENSENGLNHDTIASRHAKTEVLAPNETVFKSVCIV